MQGRMMRCSLAFTLIAAACLAVAAQGSTSPANDDPRHDMGAGICGRIIDGTLGGFDTPYYRQRMSSGSLERGSFCQCVASEFADDDDDRYGLMTAEGDEAARAMTAKITDALESCNSADGDLVGADETVDSEVRMCRMAMDGGLTIPGFNEDAVASRMKRTGQSVDDLCTCSAQKMAAKAAELDAELADAPNASVVYASTLGGTINACLR